jgi:hypothetical protein
MNEYDLIYAALREGIYPRAITGFLVFCDGKNFESVEEAVFNYIKEAPYFFKAPVPSSLNQGAWSD